MFDNTAGETCFSLRALFVVNAHGFSEFDRDLVAGLRQRNIAVELGSVQDTLCGPTPDAYVLPFDAVSDEVFEAAATLAVGDVPIIGICYGERGCSVTNVRSLLAAGLWEVLSVQGMDEVLRRLVHRAARWRAIEVALRQPAIAECTVGHSAVWKRLKRRVAEAAMHSNGPVLFLGESGTGKEQLAKLVHTLSSGSRRGRLVILDCTTVAPELSGSEFFGHDKGAFTGAVASRDGAFAQADEGTLFLDEVGELPPVLQAQLLRVVQEKTYKRLGSNNWFESNFRLVSATNRDLNGEVERQTFRFDFLQRIGTWTFHVPALRERRDDILPLASHFASRLLGGAFQGIDAGLSEFLVDRSYTGNVRELQQLVTRLCSRHGPAGPLSVNHVSELDLEVTPGAGAWPSVEPTFSSSVLAGVGLKELLRRVRHSAIRSALTETEQNVHEAAKLLKITDRALQMELAKRVG